MGVILTTKWGPILQATAMFYLFVSAFRWYLSNAQRLVFRPNLTQPSPGAGMSRLWLGLNNTLQGWSWHAHHVKHPLWNLVLTKRKRQIHLEIYGEFHHNDTRGKWRWEWDWWDDFSWKVMYNINYVPVQLWEVTSFHEHFFKILKLNFELKIQKHQIYTNFGPLLLLISCRYSHLLFICSLTTTPTNQIYSITLA